jgi:hypothetical protein
MTRLILVSRKHTILLERPSPPPALRAMILVHSVGNVHYRTQGTVKPTVMSDQGKDAAAFWVPPR